MKKKKAIIYLHGFNSASLDVDGNLLTGKEKLFVMQEFCAEKLSIVGVKVNLR